MFHAVTTEIAKYAAVAGRAMLEMAKGVLAEAQHVDMQEALTRLRRYAVQSNQRLSDLARRVVSAHEHDRRALLTELERSVQNESTRGRP